MDKRRRLELPIFPADDDIIIPAYDDTSASITALDKDIRRFETYGKVPEGLSPFVISPDYVQSLWFEGLLEAWPKSDSPLVVTPEEAAKHIADSIKKVHKRVLYLLDLQGFFLYYGLSDYCPWSESLSLGEASSVAEDAMDYSLNTPELDPLDKASSVADDAMEYPLNTPELDPLDKAPMVVDDGPKFQMKTLPVLPGTVTDECFLTVYVEVKEFSLLPWKTILVIDRLRKALANGDDYLAQQQLNQLDTGTGEYKIVDANGVKCLTKMYQIKLRGINAPDIGVDTREKLVEMVDGKRLTVVVYYFDDSCKHWVGDVYCDGIFLLDKLCGSEAFRD